MSAADLTAGQVMNISAGLLNDPSRTNYTYVAQLPYLQLALQELQEWFEQHSIPVTQDTSAVIPMDAGQTQIIYNGIAVPTLPSNFVEPKQLWERTRNIDPWVPMTRRDFLPHYLEGTQIPQFLIYSWNGQKIEVLPASGDNDIKIDYVLQLFENIVNENSLINIVNARTFLEYRTAALCAEFIERNKPSADALNEFAVLGMNRVTAISSKSKQTIMTRRRPFRSAYKKRGWVT